MATAQFTQKLRREQKNGAIIVCSAAPYEGMPVVFKPRKDRDPEPWVIEAHGENGFRYSGRECHATWPNGKKQRELTDVQKDVLYALRTHNGGTWSPDCGWHWENRSTTVRHMDALVRRGYAVRVSGEKFKEIYRITEDGIKKARSKFEVLAEDLKAT